MSNLLSTLLTNARSLQAQSRGAEIAGRNLANVNTEGYARQRVVVKDLGVVRTQYGSTSMGVEASTVQNVRDTILDKQIVRELMTQSSLQTQSDLQHQLEIAFGESVQKGDGVTTLDSTNGESLAAGSLTQALDQFFLSFQELAAEPASDPAKQLVMQRATVLVDRFHNIDKRLTDLEVDITTQIEQEMDNVNNLLSRLAELNNQIARFELNQPGSAVDLRDQRQNAIEELANLMSFETRADANNPSMLNIVGTDASGKSFEIVTGSSLTYTLAFDGTAIHTVGPLDYTLSTTGGKIHGLMQVRDNDIPELRSELNAMADHMVNTVNWAYNPTYDPADPFNHPGTGDFFDRTAVEAVASPGQTIKPPAVTEDRTDLLVTGRAYRIVGGYNADFSPSGATSNAAGTQFIYNGTLPAAWGGAQLVPLMVDRTQPITSGALDGDRLYYIAHVQTGGTTPTDFTPAGAGANTPGTTFTAIPDPMTGLVPAVTWGSGDGTDMGMLYAYTDMLTVTPKVTAKSIELFPTLNATNLKTTLTPESGKNEIAKAVGDLINTRFDPAAAPTPASGTYVQGPQAGISGTFGEYLARVVARVGGETLRMDQNLENQQIVTNFLSDRRESIMGVNVDEEMVNLLRFQRGFQASAKVITVLDELLETIVNRL